MLVVPIRYTSRILNVRKSALNCQNKTKFDMWQQSNSCPKAGQKNVTYVNDNYTLFLSSKRSFWCKVIVTPYIFEILLCTIHDTMPRVKLAFLSNFIIGLPWNGCWGRSLKKSFWSSSRSLRSNNSWGWIWLSLTSNILDRPLFDNWFTSFDLFDVVIFPFTLHIIAAQEPLWWKSPHWLFHRYFLETSKLCRRAAIHFF